MLTARLECTIRAAELDGAKCAHTASAPATGQIVAQPTKLPLLILAVAVTFTGSACDGRSDAMQHAVNAEKGEAKEKAEIVDEVPPHPMREKLLPVLEKIYPLNKPPGVVEGEITTEGEYKYELTAGVLAIIRLPNGLSTEDKIRAVVLGTAEADAWAYRPKARREYADLIHRVKSGYGTEQKEAILKSYAHLRLLEFFNSPEAEAAINALPGDVAGPVKAMRVQYTENKEKVWNDWMAVKMYARRVVAGNEPFRSVLRGIKKELGKEEPPPRTWIESMAAPQFKTWAKQIEANEELLIKLTNYRELRDREQFMNDTHSLWVIEGSPEVPAKAAKVKIDPEMGFAAMREDLGGGFNDMTYVFSKRLSGPALKKAFVRSVIYGHLLHDFFFLSAAGNDWAERTDDGLIDATTAVVPDEYDPLYARCGSGAATDTFITHFGGEFSFLAGLPAMREEEAILSKAHKCVIAGANGKIFIPKKPEGKLTYDDTPAPGSRLALFQMLARFEKVDISMAALGSQKETQEDKNIDDLEARLKAIKEKENEGVGIK